MSLIKKICENLIESDRELDISNKNFEISNYYKPKEAKRVNGNALLVDYLHKNVTYVEKLDSFEKEEKTGRPVDNIDPSFIYSIIEKNYERLGLKDDLIKRERSLKLSLRSYFILAVSEKVGYTSDYDVQSADMFKNDNWIDVLAALNYSCAILDNKGVEVAIEKYSKIISCFNNSQTVGFYPRIISDIAAFYTIYHCKTVLTFERIKSKMQEFFLAVKKPISSQERKVVDDTNYVWDSITSYIEEDEEDFIAAITRLIQKNPQNFSIMRYKTIIKNCINYLSCLSEEEKDSHINNIFKDDNVPQLSKKTKRELLKKVLRDNEDNYDYLHALLNISEHVSRHKKHEEIVIVLRSFVVLDICNRVFKKQETTGQTVFDEINKILTSGEIGVSPLSYHPDYYIERQVFDHALATFIKKEFKGEIHSDENILLW